MYNNNIYKNMSNLQIASLVLRSSDLTLNTSTQYGTCDQYRLTQTWNNINLRTLLGDMYDKYDLFNICLNTISTAAAGANTAPLGGGFADNLNVVVKLSGLPFVNQTYSVKQGCNTNICPISTFLFVNSGTANNITTTQLFFSNNCYTFGKSQQSCNLTIQYGRILDDVLPTTIYAYPNMIFIFDIVGVSKDNLTNSSTQKLI
jgi:hypothetical protein